MGSSTAATTTAAAALADKAATSSKIDESFIAIGTQLRSVPSSVPELSSALWVHRQRLGRTPNTNGTSMPSLDRVRDPPPAWPGSLRLARTDPSTAPRPNSTVYSRSPPRRGPRGSFRSCCFSSRAYVSGDALGPSGLAGARPSEAPYDAELPDPMTRFYKIRRRQDLFN
ncbi:hypothetical protein THAOC_24689, partial [Thalassiosira oceanica]